ncbi:MAG: ComEC/Rec2 family competence protein, partial [Pseudomonadota bacterium]
MQRTQRSEDDPPGLHGAVISGGQARYIRWLFERISPVLTSFDRPFLWAPVAFGLGAIGYFSLNSEPSPMVMVIGAMVAVLLVAGAFWASRSDPYWALFLFGVGLFGLGAVAGFIDTARHDQPMVNGSLGATEVTGTIIDRADREGRVRVVLTDLEIERLFPEETPKRIRISVRGGEGLRPGQRIRLRAFLNGPSGPVMPGGFDFRRYAYFHGWGAVGYSVSTPDVIEDRPAGAGSPALEQTRFSIRERIRAVLPGQDGAVATALLTGERGDLSNETVEVLRIAGLAHLLAISGLHVGLVAGLIFVSSRALMATSLRLALAWPIKKIAAVAALIGCFAYVALVGAPVPTQRAFIMAFVVLVAVMLDREAISLRTVAIAALVVLALSPNAVLGASFQLSFAAVIALVAVYEWLTENKAPTETDRSLIGRLSRYFGAVMLTTIVAGLATLPFGLFHFSRFAPWSIAANL